MAIYETTTISSSSVTQLSNASNAGKPGYTQAFVQVLDAEIVFRTDGTDPSVGNGLTVPPGGNIILYSPEEIRNFKAIATTTDATIVVGYGSTIAVNNIETPLFGIACASIPVEASNGAKINVWMDQYGRIVIAGFNPSESALNVIEQAPALMQTVEYVDQPLLDAVTSDGESFSVNVETYNKLTFHIIASGVTSGATVNIEHSLDGNNWATVASEPISSDGVTEVRFSDVKYKHVRANIPAATYTDGTYTVTMIAGN